MKKLLIPIFSVVILASCGASKSTGDYSNSGQNINSSNAKTEKAFSKAYQKIKLNDLKKNYT